MDLAVVGVAVAGGVLLGGWWVARLRRDLARREGRAAEWEGVERDGAAPDGVERGGVEQGVDLWTSAARCPECRASGALLSRDADGLLHSCLTCGHRHRRRHRG